MPYEDRRGRNEVKSSLVEEEQYSLREFHVPSSGISFPQGAFQILRESSKQKRIPYLIRRNSGPDGTPKDSLLCLKLIKIVL
jgi:hypothetical protein